MPPRPMASSSGVCARSASWAAFPTASSLNYCCGSRTSWSPRLDVCLIILSADALIFRGSQCSYWMKRTACSIWVLSTQLEPSLPQRIEVTHRLEQSGKIEQSIHWVDDRAHKDRLLTHLLSDTLLDQAIVFTATKSGADELSSLLCSAGFISAALHGDLPQSARNRTLRALRERRVLVLVATDVA